MLRPAIMLGVPPLDLSFVVIIIIIILNPMFSFVFRMVDNR